MLVWQAAENLDDAASAIDDYIEDVTPSKAAAMSSLPIHIYAHDQGMFEIYIF